MAKRTCCSCKNGFIGRAGAQYCSASCRQRARRSRSGAKCDTTGDKPVTDTGSVGGGRRSVRKPRSATGGHCAEALALLDALDAELAENSEDRGLTGDEAMSWSAAERVVLDMVADAVDRKVDLFARYLGSCDDKVRVKLSTEVRLLEGSIAKLLRSVSTDLPEPRSNVSRKASHAARVRWSRGTS